MLGSDGVTAIRAIPYSAADVAFLTALLGDDYARFAVLGDGTLKWGAGLSSADVRIFRWGPNELAIVPSSDSVGVLRVLDAAQVNNALRVDTTVAGLGIFSQGSISAAGKGSFQSLDIGGFANVIDLNRNGNFRTISLIADVTDETRAHVTKGVNKFGKFMNLDTGLVASITVTDGVITGWTEA